MPLTERVCSYCDNCVENEYDFYMECPLYSDTRHSLTSRAVALCNGFNTFSKDQRFYYFMSDAEIVLPVLNAMQHMFKRRENFIVH